MGDAERPLRKLRSCGVVIFRRKPQVSFLLMKHSSRWDLPKGHVDEGETDLECALREMEEETGLTPKDVHFDDTFEFTEVYYPKYRRYPGERIEKSLKVYLGWLTFDCEIQVTEHQGYEWILWSPPHEIQRNTIDPLLQAVAAHFKDASL